MVKPKSVGRLPLTSLQLSPALSLRITSQCFCMKSTLGRDGCCATQCTQWPTSAFGSGMCSECSPWLIAFQLSPPLSVRNAPAADIAMNMRLASDGSRMIVCRQRPPAPGFHLGPEPCSCRPGSSCQLLPPSVVRNIAASSTPAYAVSGSVSDGSMCQTRLNSHGCGVPSYHWCVPGTPSYANLLSMAVHVLPPSSER